MFKRNSKKQSSHAELPQRAVEVIRNLSWENEIVLALRRSERRGWRVAGAEGVVIALLVISIIVMLPLRTVVPYVAVIDKLTGEATIAQTFQDFVVGEKELNDKHWIKEFVIARERYDYKLLQHDYDKVKRLAGDQPWHVYSKLFDGKNSLEERYGDKVQILPNILSITLGDGGVATVRYELLQRDFRAATESVPVRRVATLRYMYEPKYSIKESEAINNPLGFIVPAYQTDAEFGAK